MKNKRPGPWVGGWILASVFLGGCGTAPLQPPIARPYQGPLWFPPMNEEAGPPPGTEAAKETKSPADDPAGGKSPSVRPLLTEQSSLDRENNPKEPGAVAAALVASIEADPATDTCQPPPPLPEGALQSMRENEVTVRPVSPRGKEADTIPGAAEKKTVSPAAPRAPTATPYGHSTDYRYLGGQVFYSLAQKGWRLRYAPVEQVDPYGGSVNLEKSALLDKLKDGQWVLVQGEFIAPQGKSQTPSFRVETVKLVDYPLAGSPEPAKPISAPRSGGNDLTTRVKDR